jgi:hypothetical protein
MEKYTFIFFPDFMKQLFGFLPIKSTICLSETNKTNRRLLTSRDNCVSLVNMYGKMTCLEFETIYNKRKYKSFLHALYFCLVTRGFLTSDSGTIFGLATVAKLIGECGREEEVRNYFKLRDRAVCYGLWKAGRLELAKSLGCMPDDRYYGAILDGIVASGNLELLKSTICEYPLDRAKEELMTPFLTAFRNRNLPIFQYLLPHAKLYVPGLQNDLSGMYTEVFRENNEEFMTVIGFEFNYLETLLAMRAVTTERQIDHLLGKHVNAANKLHMVCEVLSSSNVSAQLKNYIQDQCPRITIEILRNEAIQGDRNLLLSYLISSEQLKITQVPWKKEVLSKPKILATMATHKHPSIPKYIGYIFAARSFDFCKDLIRRYVKGKDSKIDPEKKMILESKYPNNKILSSLLTEL